MRTIKLVVLSWPGSSMRKWCFFFIPLFINCCLCEVWLYVVPKITQMSPTIALLAYATILMMMAKTPFKELLASFGKLSGSHERKVSYPFDLLNKYKVQSNEQFLK